MAPGETFTGSFGIPDRSNKYEFYFDKMSLFF